MDPAALSMLVALALMVPLFLAGVHIGVVLGISGVIGSIVFTGNVATGFNLPLIQAISVSASYSLMVIPLFIGLGALAAASGMTTDLFNMSYRWVGRVPGGIGVATVAACAGMASITGSSVATSAAMARIALPELRRFNYDEGLSVGVVAAGGTVAIMIPPSITLILFAIFAEQSVGKLLIAGILPGLLSSLLYAVMIIGRCKLNPRLGPIGPKFNWREKWSSVPNVVPFVGIVLVILLGILFGIWTPTESAAVGVVFVMLVGLVRRRLSLARLAEAFVDAVVSSASVLMVVIGSLIFSNFLALNGFSEIITEEIVALDLSPFALFVMFMFFYLVLGTVMEPTGILALTIPLVMPIVAVVGWSPIWFGVILVKMMEVAAVTPPVGLNLYAVKAAVPEVPISTIYRGTVFFWLIDIAVVFLLYLLPIIVLVLPNLM